MRRLAILLITASSFLLLGSAAATAAPYHVYICASWSNNPGPFIPSSVAGTQAAPNACGSTSGQLVINRWGLTPVRSGHGASWVATAPANITISHIYTVNDESFGVGDGNGWWGEFFWAGGPGPTGRSGQITDGFGQFGCCKETFDNRQVGWLMDCGWSSCDRPAGINVGGVDLTVNESEGPWLVAPSGLWDTTGWVRDKWQLAFYGDSPSGVCDLYAAINGQAVTLGTSAAVGKVQDTWHQCSGASASPTIQTADYGQGPMPLTIEGCDAASVCTNATYTRTIQVDNSHPWVALPPPGNAPITAGTQDVTATAGGSPSGISHIDCGVDGGPLTRYPEGDAQQPSAQVPISGLGEHAIQCIAANGAIAQDGSPGWSTAPATTTFKIGEPTISAISFAKVIDKLRCSQVRVRVTVPAHWVTARRHHKLVHIRRRARVKSVKVTRCHPRTARRRVTVWVTVSRGGKPVRVRRTEFARVILLPHVVNLTIRRVPHGRGTTVSGWLGASTGVALAGQTVRVLTAPDNQQGQFSQAAVVTTGANGGWSAELPPGPSRLVEAVYDGGPTTEPSTSTEVHLIVPAKVKLISVSPARVAWGGTVRIVGQLQGGYLPAGGALLRLRIGSGSSYTTYGVQEHVTGNGRFSTSYTFGAGLASVFQSFWFQLAALPMSSYPYSPASSGRRFVLVGGHPAIVMSPRVHHHKRRRYKRRR